MQLGCQANVLHLHQKKQNQQNILMKKQIFTGAFALLALASCGGGETHSHEKDIHTEEATHGTSDEIVLTPGKAKAAGVKTQTIKAGTFCGVIHASGQILASQGDEATVVASTSGIVSFVRPLAEGMAVAENKPVLTVSGSRIQDGDAVGRARVAYETAKSEYERASKLVGEQIVSQKDFNTLKEAYENARIAYKALSPSADGQGVSVVSPLTGYVKSCLVKEGDYVTIGQPLMTVTQTRRLRLRADVPERHYPMLREVASAHFRTSYNDHVYPLDSLNGRLLSYGRSTGDTSYYIPVTFEFDNRGEVLPGAFAEVWLLSGKRQGVISVPHSALTEEQGVKFVYVQLDTECYQKREVKTGADDGTNVEILSGLKEGEKLVTEGAIHVKLASASNAIPAHTHNH